jgi:DNA processing protein
VSIVGSRASTAYGEHVTALLAAGVAERGFTVVSGGAYGVDATAHRACIGAEGETVAVMAGGVDRFYPPGNHALLRRVIDCGAVVSESPPGAVAYKARFLSRNRLIAALTSATVVVEAAWRSGALSTARHAAGLMRPVGAVPGPVTSMASGGCHQLLRDGIATCVTDAAEVAELAGTFGGDTLFDAVTDVDGMPVLDSWSMEGLDLTVRRIYDTIPLRGSISVATMTKNAGCSLSETLGALGILEARTLVTPTPQNRWKRTKR